MSTTITIFGFRPATDQKWKDMKAVWDACKKAYVRVPAQVEEFFEYDDPHDEGVKVDLEDAITKSRTEDDVQYKVDLTKIPKDVNIITFEETW